MTRLFIHAQTTHSRALSLSHARHLRDIYSLLVVSKTTPLTQTTNVNNELERGVSLLHRTKSGHSLSLMLKSKAQNNNKTHGQPTCTEDKKYHYLALFLWRKGQLELSCLCLRSGMHL